MDDSSTTILSPDTLASQKSRKCLVFDRRYGWIVDDWRDPSEESLAGGRGMFCIVPIAKTLAKIVSGSIDFAGESIKTIKAKPEQFSFAVIKTSLVNQFHKADQSIQRLNLGFRGVNSP